MPVPLLQPGVYIEEISSGVRTITGVATSITLFVGWAPRGRVDRAVRVANFAEFERVFGGLDRRAMLGYSVRQFYDNGGSDAYILRIVENDAATAACDIGDLHIVASSPGGWASGYSVRLTRRLDDATGFKLEVIVPANNNAVVKSFELVHGSRRSALCAGGNQRPLRLPRGPHGREHDAAPATPRSHLDSTTPGNDGTVIGPADNSFHPR